jgi:hypothetical protein
MTTETFQELLDRPDPAETVFVRFLRDVARDVRVWAEMLQSVRGGHEDLCGFCAIASAELWRRLKALGIYSQLHVSEDDWCSHVYVVVEEHIVDVTATQFSDIRGLGRDKVYISHYRMATSPHHETQEIFETASALLRWQRSRGWPRDQQALTLVETQTCLLESNSLSEFGE